ncbi:MAG TPA: putative sulfate exporter family transporter [Actinoplanes sp.]|nr:putative sulfate exporter family transporter [Actinoplanes sp.]
MIVLATPAARRRLPVHSAGSAAAVALGLAATACGLMFPLVGAPVFAVAGGVLLSPLARRATADLRPGLDLSGGPLLQLSVVLLGAQLSLGEVLTVGARSLPVMLGTLGVCLLLAAVAGRLLGVPRDLRTLIGVGTGICGASAIAAATPAIRAKSDDVAYAVSTIFLFNIAAVLCLPQLGHLLGLSQEAFGLLAGTAVNDTSSVVAAAGAYGPEAVRHAVVVKLARSLMIIPVVLVLSIRHRGPHVHRARLVPWFLLGFLAVAALNTAGYVPAQLGAILHHVALLCIAVAMAAIGLRTDVTGLRRAGIRPLLLGLLLSTAVTGTSLGMQFVLPGAL